MATISSNVRVILPSTTVFCAVWSRRKHEKKQSE